MAAKRITPPKNIQPAYVTADEAAKYLNISKRSLDKLQAEGKLRVYMLTRRRAFKITDLDELMLRNSK